MGGAALLVEESRGVGGFSFSPGFESNGGGVVSFFGVELGGPSKGFFRCVPGPGAGDFTEDVVAGIAGFKGEGEAGGLLRVGGGDGAQNT